MFARLRETYLDDDQYRELQEFSDEQSRIRRDYPGLGWRSQSWRLAGAGKSGGIRVIYFVRYRPNEFLMLTLYAKAKMGRIPAGVAAKKLKEAFGRE